VARLQDQHLEHQHVVERRPAALRSVRARHRPFEVRPKQLEIHYGIQPFQLVALGRELFQPFLDIEKSTLTPHPQPPSQARSIESRTAKKREVLGGLQPRHFQSRR
jgi:hypothetical protein